MYHQILHKIVFYLGFCRLPVRPQGRPGPTDTGPVAEPSGQDTKNIVITDLPGPAIYVSNLHMISCERGLEVGETPARGLGIPINCKFNK